MLLAFDGGALKLVDALELMIAAYQQQSPAQQKYEGVQATEVEWSLATPIQSANLLWRVNLHSGNEGRLLGALKDQCAHCQRFQGPQHASPRPSAFSPPAPPLGAQGENPA